jgi:hypothetical protein
LVLAGKGEVVDRWGKSIIFSIASVALVGTLSGCGGGDASTAPSSVSVEPSSPATLESSLSTDLDDYAAPLTFDEIRERQAIAVATSGCLRGQTEFATKEDGFMIFPRLWLGVILNHGLNTEVLSVPKKRDDFIIFMLDIHYSDYMTKSLETAAALDPKFQPLVDIWQKAGNRAIKMWNQGGIDASEVLSSDQASSQRLTARCKVPVMQAFAFAENDNISLDEWIQATASGLLPEAWDDKEFIDMPLE